MTAASQRQPRTRAPGLVTGKVTLHEGATFGVALDEGGEVVARRAASCLLAPDVGDRVLIAPLDDEPFLLAVLERQGDTEARLTLEGDATLETSGKLGIRSAALEVHTGPATLFAQRLDAAAVSAKATFGKLGVMAKRYERVADSVIERAKRAYRFVEEMDQLRSGHLDYRAEKTAQVKGETTVVTARAIMKIDGESVHIG